MTNLTRRFVVLSQSVNTSSDVFNNLVEVQDKATGEQGLLLCSHMCHWPSELISQATWLEGCKTPEEYKDETRLALGYHPDQYTQWRVFKETNEIEIYLTGSWTQTQADDQQQYNDFVGDTDGDIWLHTGLPRPQQSFTGRTGRYQLADQRHRFTPSLIRLFERILGSYVTQDKIDLLESTVHRLFNSGRISAWEATVLPYWMLTVIVPWEQIHWEGHPSLFLGEGLEAYIDGGIYSQDRELIPYSTMDGMLLVNHSLPNAGFYASVYFEVSYDTYENHDMGTVHYCNPDDFLADELLEQ